MPSKIYIFYCNTKRGKNQPVIGHAERGLFKTALDFLCRIKYNKYKKFGGSEMLFLAYFIIYLLIFVFGAVLGSFLNVLIYRLPTGESIVTGGSHCMTCKKPIKKYDLIPVISYIILRGKCRSCRAKISTRYMVVELLNAALYVLTFLYFGIDSHSLEAALCCVVLSCLIVVFFMDLDTQTINIGIVAAIFIMAAAKLILSLTGVIEPLHPVGLLSALIGAFSVSLVFFLIALISKERAMGYGDAMLMLAVGGFLGIKAVIIATFIGLITGSVAGLITKYKTKDSHLAFGPWLSLGAAAAIFCGDYLANLYLTITRLSN